MELIWILYVFFWYGIYGIDMDFICFFCMEFMELIWILYVFLYGIYGIDMDFKCFFCMEF